MNAEGLGGKSVAVARARAPIYDVPHVADRSCQRELVAGELFAVSHVVVDQAKGAEVRYAFGTAERDGYTGYIEVDLMAEPRLPQTHVVAARETPLQPKPGVKYGPTHRHLFHGARLQVLDKTDDGLWAQIQVSAKGPPDGWVFADHLRDISTPEIDPVHVAQRFLGSPYVWGGNTGRGIDCSGLIQNALLACDVPCPGDSGPQHAAFADPSRRGLPFVAGELLFWKGHVAMATGSRRMIHATAYAMLVIEEDIIPALRRIEATGEAPWLGRGLPKR